MTQDEIIEKLKSKELDLTDVIDAIIKVNGIIGVGLITLGDDLKAYCYHHKQRLREKIEKNENRKT